MQYEPGNPTKLILDHSDEFQAVGWAASEVRRINPDDPEVQSAYESALDASLICHSDSESLTLRGKKADTLLSVIKQWVEAGPPEEGDPVTYPARQKSYRTACAIVARTVEPTSDSTQISS